MKFEKKINNYFIKSKQVFLNSSKNFRANICSFSTYIQYMLVNEKLNFFLDFATYANFQHQVQLYG